MQAPHGPRLNGSTSDGNDDDGPVEPCAGGTSDVSSSDASSSDPTHGAASTGETGTGDGLFANAWTAGQVAELVELQRQESAVQARRAVLLTQMSSACDSPDAGWTGRAPWGSMLMDVAGALTVHQATVGRWVDDSRHLALKHPKTLAALGQGRVHWAQVTRLLGATANASAAVCAEVEAQLIDVLPTLAPAQVERLAKAAVLQADPQLAADDHERAIDNRRVRVRPQPDGMVDVTVSTDAVSGRQHHHALADLEERSRQDQTGFLGIPLSKLGKRSHRTADLMVDLPELCAELLDLTDGVLPSLEEPSLVQKWFPTAHTRALAGLLVGRTEPGPDDDSDETAGVVGQAGAPNGKVRRRVSRRRGRKRQVRIDVPAVTCTRGMGGVGWVEGYGPIAASQALALLPTAEIRRGLVDPDTGRLLALDPPGHTPTLEQALEQAREALARERQQQRAWTRERFIEEHRWDGVTERRSQPRPERTDAERAAEREAVDLLLRWRAAQAPPTVDTSPDTSTLTPLDRQLLALTLADRELPPEDPSRRVEPQHDPSPDLDELVVHRDDTCDGPGCAVPARRCDRDHHHPYTRADEPEGEAAGTGGTRTSAASLIPRSERCHQAKHHPSWTVISHGDGTSTWTSPTGQTITTRSTLRPLLPPPKPWRPQT